MTSRVSCRRLAPLALALALGACGTSKPPAAKPVEQDPAESAALASQIMVDPDLVGNDRNQAALTGGGPAVAEVPLEPSGPDAAAVARTEAARIAGGHIASAPPTHSSPAQSGLSAELITAAERARAAGPAGGGACAGKVEYTMAWAARLPGAFPVYPRGHVQEAAGTDADGCKLRVVNYRTAVAVKDVIDFYYTRARAAGFAAEHRREGNDDVLGGARGGAAYVVYARPFEGGLSEVDLVTSGE
ncbi:MAG: hypothetical protein JF593_00760 [Novosphingobium sp.]|nr:hypothetical protein [Novosphingobium sp.]